MNQKKKTARTQKHCTIISKTIFDSVHQKKKFCKIKSVKNAKRKKEVATNKKQHARAIIYDLSLHSHTQKWSSLLFFKELLRGKKSFFKKTLRLY